MQNNNPYQAPAANFDLPQSSEMTYAGFWVRAGAMLLDAVVMLPIIGIVFYGNMKLRLFSLYWFVPGIVLGLFINVYLVHRFGGSPGKQLMKLRIATLDGHKVSLKTALARFSVQLILTTIMGAGSILGAMAMTDAEYLSLDFMARSAKMTTLAPAWYKAMSFVMNGWFLVGAIVLLCNKKRRATHDFIAGTVVLRKS